MRVVGMIAPIVLAMGGCSSLYMMRLPFQCQVVEQRTQMPIENVDAKLVWRVGFGGITWGTPVVLHSDSSGVIRVTTNDIPAYASTGYALGKQPQKIMINRLTLEAEGYETLCFKDYKLPPRIEMQRSSANVETP